MGADGFSVWLMALTVAISVVLIHSQPRDHERLSIRLSWILLTESALLGSIAALDIILLSFTSLLSVTGISFLIAESGDRSRREAARRFFIVQLASGVLLMIGLTGIAVSHWWMQLNEKMQHPVLTFSLTTLQEQIPQLAESSQPALEFWNTLSPWLFLIIGCALLIRLPIPPLHHNWLRVAEHADRRVAALIVAGYLPLTMHLLLRVLLPLFPAQSAALAGRLALWGVAGSLFLSLVAAATPCRQRRLATVALSGTTAAAGTCFLQQPTIIQGAALTTVALAAACALTVLCRTRSGPGLSSRRQAPTVPRVPTALLQGIPIFALAGLSLMPLTAGFWGGLLILEGLFSFDPTLALVLLISFGLSGWTIQAELLRQPGLSFRPQQTAPVRHTEKPGLQHVSVATLIPLAVIFATLSLCPRLVLDQRSAPDSERREAHLKVSRPDSRSHRIPGTLTMPRGVKRITTAK